MSSFESPSIRLQITIARLQLVRIYKLSWTITGIGTGCVGPLTNSLRRERTRFFLIGSTRAHESLSKSNEQNRVFP